MKIIVRQRLGRPPEADSFIARLRDAFRLLLPPERPLRTNNFPKNLQNEVALQQRIFLITKRHFRSYIFGRVTIRINMIA